MSHGIASIISILSKIYAHNLNKLKSGKMLIEAVNYLLFYQQDIKEYSSCFPNIVSLKNHKKNNSRLAWCYGDLGIGIALLNTANNINDNTLREEAIGILLHSARRKDLKENNVLDAGVCHGTAGIAHIFNRAYRYTQIEEFKVASEYWFGQTLKMAKFEDGLAGFKTWRTPEYGGWQNEYGLLQGIAGIGLSMISAISDIEPKWDECLLLS